MTRPSAVSTAPFSNQPGGSLKRTIQRSGPPVSDSPDRVTCLSDPIVPERSGTSRSELATGTAVTARINPMPTNSRHNDFPDGPLMVVSENEELSKLPKREIQNGSLTTARARNGPAGVGSRNWGQRPNQTHEPR